MAKFPENTKSFCVAVGRYPINKNNLRVVFAHFAIFAFYQGRGLYHVLIMPILLLYLQFRLQFMEAILYAFVEIALKFKHQGS